MASSSSSTESVSEFNADEIIAFINNQKKPNTTNSTKQHIEKLQSWLKDTKNVHSPLLV